MNLKLIAQIVETATVLEHDELVLLGKEIATLKAKAKATEE